MWEKYSKRTERQIDVDDHLIFYGHADFLHLNLVEKLAIETIVGKYVQNDSMAYKKFSINKTVSHSSAYERMHRCKNSIVETSTGTFMSIDNIVCVQFINGPKMYIVLGKSFSIYGNLNWCSYSGFSSRDLYYPVKKNKKPKSKTFLDRKSKSTSKTMYI